MRFTVQTLRNGKGVYAVKCSEKSMRLYAVTGGTSSLPLAEQVRQAVAGGATFVQLREKTPDHAEIVRKALELKEICAAAKVPLVIDDDVRAAREADVDGVHVGQSDMALADARRLLGPGKIVGVSVHTVEEALTAERGGADYLGVGAMFATATKTDAEVLSFETLREICAAVRIPVVAIGGISMENLPRFAGSGADGAAVVSAIFSQPDIRKAAAELRLLADRVFAE